MPDWEKVFDAIRNCITEPKCKDCPWDECEKFDCKKVSIPVSLMLDALKLLKEQEPVAPVLVGRMWECGKCHAPVGIFMDDQRDQFCRTCGTKVKWDE